MSQNNEAKIQDLLKAIDVDFYNFELPHPALFPSEYCTFVRKWKQKPTNLPKDLVGTLEACDPTSFPSLIKYSSRDRIDNSHNLM